MCLSIPSILLCLDYYSFIVSPETIYCCDINSTIFNTLCIYENIADIQCSLGIVFCQIRNPWKIFLENNRLSNYFIKSE